MNSPVRIGFQVGPVVIRWYGILMATAIVVGLWLGYRQAKREGLPADDIISAGQWAILAGLAGARVYEVIFNWDYYGRYPSKIVAVWEGSLAMHGGLIVGPLVGAWLAYRWRLPILRGLDVAAPSLALGQAIGRRVSVATADLARARRRRAVDGARAGHRPVGQLLQRGGLRPPDRS